MGRSLCISKSLLMQLKLAGFLVCQLRMLIDNTDSLKFMVGFVDFAIFFFLS